MVEPRLAIEPDAYSLNLVARLTAPPPIRAGGFAPWPATLYLALPGNAKFAERRTAMSIPIGLLLLCVAMALAVGDLIVVQRLVPIAVRWQHNDVVGFIYAVPGVTYAVLLGLMVVAVWEDWNSAAVTADDEASSLAEIFWIADRMTESDGHHIQELARSYV